PVLSTAVFFVTVVAVGYVFARVRLASGSVWPAVLLHSAWNSVVQGTFDAFVPGHDSAHAGNVWVGESGLIVLAVQLAVALLLVWRPFPLRRWPGDEAGTGSIRTL